MKQILLNICCTLRDNFSTACISFFKVVIIAKVRAFGQLFFNFPFNYQITKEGIFFEAHHISSTVSLCCFTVVKWFFKGL